MHLIVAGSRSFTDYPLMVRTLDQFVLSHQPPSVTVISGTARGADQLGEHWAKKRGYSVIQVPAMWATYGKSAGYKRNVVMAAQASHCVVFWDGQSRGAQHMINIARQYGLITLLIVSKPPTAEGFK